MITEREQAKLDKALTNLQVELDHWANKIKDHRKAIAEEPLEYWKTGERKHIREYQSMIREAKAIKTLIKENEKVGHFSQAVWNVYLEWFDTYMQEELDGSKYPHPDHVGYPAEHEQQTWGYGDRS